MVDLIAQILSVAIDSSFALARPFSKDWLDQVATRALVTFRDRGLRPEQIVLRTTDVLFGYELGFSLFAGSATLALSGAHLLLNFQNVTSRAALETVCETIARVHTLFDENLFSEHVLRAIAHMPLRNQTARIDELLADRAQQIEFLGKLAHVRVDGWEESIRFEADRSLIFPNAVFISWTSKWHGKLETDTLRRAAAAFESAAKKFDFSVEVTP